MSKTIIDKIIESTSYVIENSKHVKINQDKIEEFCKKFDGKKMERTDWTKEVPINFNVMDVEEYINHQVTFNALSFSYWGEPYWNITYKNKTYVKGSWSMNNALIRSKEEGFDIRKPTNQANITKKELGFALRGNTEIPLLQERVEILKEIGSHLIKYYDGKFINFIKEANYDGEKLLEKLINEFPSFDDTAIYKGKKVYFYKRAQALMQSLKNSFKEYNGLTNWERSTALPDYIMPVKMRAEGMVEFDKDLSHLVDNKIELPRRGIYEINIRSAEKEVIHRVAVKLGLTDSEVNDHFWLTGRESKGEYIRVRTTDY